MEVAKTDSKPMVVAPGSSFLTQQKAFSLNQVPVVEIQIEPSARVVMHSDPHSPGADRFRFLRMGLRERWKAGGLKRLLITSPLPGDGKSTVALNLATTLAEHGKRSVLLIEGDLYHPTLAEVLGIPDCDGLADCLEDRLDPFLALRRVEPLSWYFLPAGKSKNNPTELLQSERINEIMLKLSAYFDWILVDSPPIVPLSDASLLLKHTDASLLVVRADSTPRESVEDALALIGPKHALGIILNAAEGLNRVYSKYYGYYGKKK